MHKTNEDFYWLIGICIGIMLFCMTDSSIWFTEEISISIDTIRAIKDAGRIFVSLSAVIITMCKHAD